MVNLILISLLLFGFLVGLKRGLILQAVHLIGFIVAFIVAALFYDDLSKHFGLLIPYPELKNDSLWADFLQAMPLETAFYNAISFALIFFIVKFGLQIFASMIDVIASLPILNSINKILGAILGFLEVYLIIFVILFIIALTPIEAVQQYINNSSVALFIVENTPYFSDKIKDLWSTHIVTMMNL
ncbi:CvpA family protein [Ornithinibacillus halotolerans]|uniref:Transmembrane protein YshB n=1 Tax=Ornithinibacillus halotolerans TaxID=1274357 RepID=A0A916S689_9BACI|nr:CvpA family protein [Ornithinibacillus halotolerans]GGA86258.1 putative transmembrane protein YshB [Ornithinibacillus halotolerans]